MGTAIFLLLDPTKQLRGVKYAAAKTFARDLVRELDRNLRDTVSAQLLKAIALREQCAKRYKWAPKRAWIGHIQYITFLKVIYQKLSTLDHDKAPVLEAEEHRRKKGRPKSSCLTSSCLKAVARRARYHD